MLTARWKHVPLFANRADPSSDAGALGRMLTGSQFLNGQFFYSVPVLTIYCAVPRKVSQMSRRYKQNIGCSSVMRGLGNNNEIQRTSRKDLSDLTLPGRSSLLQIV